MGNTSGNLNEAFAGESKANRMYTAFAKKADEEGHKQVAKLFRAAAAAETVHALNHLNAMDAVKDTVENLKLAVHKGCRNGECEGREVDVRCRKQSGADSPRALLRCSGSAGERRGSVGNRILRLRNLRQYGRG